MDKIMMILIGYVTLYIVVWLHEVGHAIAYSAYGCKKKWWKVNVKPYIFFSTPAPVDGERVQELKNKQHVIVSYGGVAVNLIGAMISGCYIYWMGDVNKFIELFVWLFFTLHMAEIVSYMMIGNIYLVSDMAIIAAMCPKLRVPNLLIGALVTIVYVICLQKIPNNYLVFVLVWNVVTILCMCGGRIVFTILHARRANNHD